MTVLLSGGVGSPAAKHRPSRPRAAHSSDGRLASIAGQQIPAFRDGRAQRPAGRPARSGGTGRRSTSIAQSATAPAGTEQETWIGKKAPATCAAGAGGR